MTPTSNDNAQCTDTLRQRARNQVQQEMDKLELGEKEAYLEATKKSPHVVESESDPLKFLRFCGHDAKAAAKRICLYWRERKSLFGEERAFRPLDLSEDGALTREDILSLRAGWPVLLPDAKTGQKVLLADRRQFHPASTAESRLRCTFYMAQKVSEDEKAHKLASIVLCIGSVARAPPMDLVHADRCIRLARSVFPNKTRYYYLNLPSPASKRHEVQDIMANNIDSHINFGSKLDDVEVHFEREQGDLRQVLLDLGLTDKGIPTYLGGSWTFVANTNHCRAQVRADRSHQRSTKRKARQQQQRRRRSEDSGSESCSSREVAKNKDNDGFGASKALREKRQRERNVIHSRRKRDRRRQELFNLKDEHQQMEGEQEYLQAEHERLTRLLVEAQQMVAQVEQQRDCKRQRTTTTTTTC